ncbi:Type I transmembrane sorting receptor, partial [Tulasnella sp. UAMH 9824]
AISNSTPFFANLVAEGCLASNVFSFFMTRGGATGSELCLGCVNSEKYTGSAYFLKVFVGRRDIEYYPVVTFTKTGEPFEWDLDSTGIFYNCSKDSSSGQLSKPWKSKGFTVTIDSGTTFIYVSKEIAKEFYAKIPNSRPASPDWGDGSYAFPCDSLGDIGTISFGFGDKQYAIDLRDFNAGPESDGSADCVGGIFGDDLWGGIAVLGDAFMKNWYSVFDYVTPAIGFAKAV